MVYRTVTELPLPALQIEDVRAHTDNAWILELKNRAIQVS